MDRIDRNILNQLQEDASISNSDLAAKVGLAPSSCLRRVRHLKTSGVIKKTIVLTDAERLGRGIKAIVTVKLADHGMESRTTWLSTLKNEPAVSQVYSVSGETDVIVVMTMGSMQEFQIVSRQLFATDRNVIQYLSQFVLEEHKFCLKN